MSGCILDIICHRRNEAERTAGARSSAMASLLRQVGTGANSQSLEEARKRVFHFLREACRSIPQIMETYNIHEVITPSQLRSVVVAQFRKQAHLTNPKVFFNILALNLNTNRCIFGAALIGVY